MVKFERKVCPPIKDKRPKGMRSIPIIGYELMRVYQQRLRMVDEAVKELRDEKPNEEEER